MRLRFLFKLGSSAGGSCPAFYATDRGTYVVQGIRMAGRDAVAIPYELAWQILGYMHALPQAQRTQPEQRDGSVVRQLDGGLAVLGEPLTTETAALMRQVAADESGVEITPAVAERIAVEAASLTDLLAVPRAARDLRVSTAVYMLVS